jgi:hypothetical protein
MHLNMFAILRRARLLTPSADLNLIPATAVRMALIQAPDSRKGMSVTSAHLKHALRNPEHLIGINAGPTH